MTCSHWCATRLLIATPSKTLFPLPYWIATHKGFFKDEGLSPQLEFVTNGEQLTNGFRDGTIDLAISPAESVILDAFRGGPLRIIGENACKPPLFVIAQPEIRSAEDLHGKTFGVLSSREGSSKFIPLIAASGGLQPSEYKVKEVGGAPARVKLLIARKIDAGLQRCHSTMNWKSKGSPISAGRATSFLIIDSPASTRT